MLSLTCWRKSKSGCHGVSERSLGARSIRFVCLCLISVSMPATLRGQVSDAAPAGVIVGDQSLEIPFVIAARGASAYLPEHTLEATVLAHAMRADYIGLGCVLTRDGVPVVLQDLILDNVSSVATDFPGRQRENGHWYVMDFSLDELRTLSIHEPTADQKTREQADSRFPQGSSRFRISTLEEHVQLVRGLNQTTGRRAGLYLDLRDPEAHLEQHLDLTAAVSTTLQRSGYTRPDSPVFVQCVSLTQLQRLRKPLFCPLPLVWQVSEPLSDNQLREASAVCDGIAVAFPAIIRDAPAAESKTTSFIERAHSRGLQVHVWNLPTTALPVQAESTGDGDLDRICKAGVDGIFGEYPDKLVSWRDRQREAVPGARQFRLLRRDGEIAPQQQRISERDDRRVLR